MLKIKKKQGYGAPPSLGSLMRSPKSGTEWGQARWRRQSESQVRMLSSSAEPHRNHHQWRLHHWGEDQLRPL